MSWPTDACVLSAANRSISDKNLAETNDKRKRAVSWARRLAIDARYAAALSLLLPPLLEGALRSSLPLHRRFNRIGEERQSRSRTSASLRVSVSATFPREHRHRHGQKRVYRQSSTMA